MVQHARLPRIFPEDRSPPAGLSYEGGFSDRTRRISTEASVFANTIYGNIVYQLENLTDQNYRGIARGVEVSTLNLGVSR